MRIWSRASACAVMASAAKAASASACFISEISLWASAERTRFHPFRRRAPAAAKSLEALHDGLIALLLQVIFPVDEEDSRQSFWRVQYAAYYFDSSYSRQRANGVAPGYAVPSGTAEMITMAWAWGKSSVIVRSICARMPGGV